MKQPALMNRHTGIDVLRIASMLSITAIHYINYSGLLEVNNILFANKILFTLLYNFAIASINLFPLISGYLLALKPFSVKRVVRLWFDVIFTSLLFLLIGICLWGVPSIATVIKSILPVSAFGYWYINTHIILLFVTPFLNMIIKKLDSHQHFLLCCVCTLGISVFLVTNPFAHADIVGGHGHGIVWFSLMFMWGAWFSREKTGFPKYGTVFLLSISLISITILRLIKDNFSVLDKCSVFEMNSPFMITISIATFQLLKGIKLKNDKLIRCLRILAESSLFVYLIQEHNAIRSGFWSLFQITRLAGSYHIWIEFALALICLWPLAVMMKKITSRIWLFFDEWFSKVLCRFDDKIRNSGVI